MGLTREGGSPISPRLVVLGTLLVSYGLSLVVPLRLTRPPSGLSAIGYVAGLALVGGALALVLRSAVSPAEPSPRSSSGAPSTSSLVRCSVGGRTYV